MTNPQAAAMVWFKAFRCHFTPPSFLPAAFGAVMAWAMTGRFDQLLYLVTIAGVTINHLALNMTDDYFDYMTGVDIEGVRCPYTGGSGVLTEGLITPLRLAAAFIICYTVTVALGVYLTYMAGWPIAVFMVFGVGCSFFYTAPPIRYGYRGLGELSQLVNFSWTIGLGSYYVQARTLSWEPFWALLPLGLIMFSMIVINEIPDEADDAKGGKRTLVVRYGRHAGRRLYESGVTLAYLAILLCPAAGLTSYWSWLALATLPWFLSARRTLADNTETPQLIAPACLQTIRLHNITGLLLIAGYLIEGYLHDRSLQPLAIPLFSLALLYLPVARKIFPPGDVNKAQES